MSSLYENSQITQYGYIHIDGQLATDMWAIQVQLESMNRVKAKEF